ncbi:J domain-containing protein [Natrialbaceae archaeon A-arb3/5]
MTADFYDLLDVPPDASQDEITTAYREKVQTYHPDVNDDERARSQFTAVKKAREILSDPVERQAYDRLGHEEYVRKRTSGLPSPDVWADNDDSSTETKSASETTETGESGETNEAASATSSGADATSGSSGWTDSSRTRSKSTASASTGANATGGNTRSTGWSSSSDSAAGSASGATTDSNGTASESTGWTNTGGDSGADGGSTRRTRNRSTSTSNSSHAGSTASHRQQRTTRSALVRWWRRRNVALPLIWLSVLVYGIGLAQFALANESGIATVRTELVLVGADPAALWTVISSGRYGIQTPTAFVSSVEPVSPPLAPTEWYAVLVGLVCVSLAIAAAIRLGWREDSRGPISMAETILVASALAISTGLLGGPLLAGAVLMPFLFGVVVYHTRRGSGWTPSYLYVVPVLAPIGGLAADSVGYATLPVDVLVFVLLPVVGALGLPLRATIRKHFDL